MQHGQNPILQRAEKAVLEPLMDRISGPAAVTYAVFALALACALGAWGWQIMNGMGVTGLNNPVFWGVYIVNFVFFIGVSHAGTLISAILRITDARWRTPYTRMAEMITITSLPFAGSCVIVDLGRPDRALNVILYPHLTSPILWDVMCISTYVIMSCLYFYIALIPDLAMCRDRLTRAPQLLRWFYRLAALQWTDTPEQHRVHNRIMTVMSIALLALVISVHTNVGFIFGMTIKPGWHTAVIGPYFVIGAALQGLGCLGLGSVVLRRMFKLEAWITEYHMNNLRKFTLALVCFWTYFTGAEILTTVYGAEPSEMRVLMSKVTGPYWWTFWGMLSGCFLLPFILLAFRPVRTTAALAWSGVVINVGMWLERYQIIVPTGANPFIHSITGTYAPSLIEWTITLGWLLGFFLLLLAFTRVFPILTVWEIREEVEQDAALAAKAVAEHKSAAT